MKITIKREKMDLEIYTKVPQHRKIYDLPPAAFKLYVWLLSHKDGFNFAKMFMKIGTKLHNKTIDTSLDTLVKRGFIEIIRNDNSTDTIIIKSDYQK